MTLNRILDGSPPRNITALEAIRFTDDATLRTNTEYNAHVNAAANKLRFPRNKVDEKLAVRGSITAITPAVAATNAMTRRGVVCSRSRNGANNKTKAGVADVTNEPLEAVDSFVPTNWNPKEMP